MGSGEGVKLYTMKPKPKQLGELDIAIQFRIKGRKTLYRTIDHMESVRWVAQTKRWCLNLSTNKAEYLFCDLFVVEHIESSK
jgi:hypothetical protein